MSIIALLASFYASASQDAVARLLHVGADEECTEMNIPAISGMGEAGIDGSPVQYVLSFVLTLNLNKNELQVAPLRRTVE
ncbi:uncharacterized protein FOMMEDRAFT_152251 [Fomitiporia mediterranea MF3/22]|uniref:uncharacterized protein n=1 Tax=Fomitiporia mediterranea (strain MF3/22) TaxID=694068 RepID=UPI0004408384|nr:uncharacterized protein FOMMEDRAFT_152251 [Fomitiporia mediterranea MF3/22]EJD06918.1 hypothetical protein FOMMEDRAFT_152251 [Fomitiporia mediterranea MF3/22]